MNHEIFRPYFVVILVQWNVYDLFNIHGMWNIKIFSALITVAVPDSKRDQLSPQRGRLLNKMSLELRWLHLLLHFKILPTQHLRKQLATVCPMVRVLVYSYEDKALGSNVIIRTCVKLFVVFTTGENGDFRYKAMCLVFISYKQFSDPALSWACQVPCLQ